MPQTQVLLPGPDHPLTVEPTDGHVTVKLGGRVIAETDESLTLREASYPAAQYLPLSAVDPTVLEPSDHTTYCPYKGSASYYSLKVGDDVAPAAVWTYREPHEAVAEIKDHVAFYPDRVDSIQVTAAS